MSKSDVKRTYFIVMISPILAAVFVVTAFDQAAQGSSWQEYFCWALVGVSLMNCVLMPTLIYGYHNRHRIDASTEETLDFAPAVRGALIGTAAVPFARVLFDWLGGG